MARQQAVEIAKALARRRGSSSSMSPRTLTRPKSPDFSRHPGIESQGIGSSTSATGWKRSSNWPIG